MAESDNCDVCATTGCIMLPPHSYRITVEFDSTCIRKVQYYHYNFFDRSLTPVTIFRFDQYSQI